LNAVRIRLAEFGNPVVVRSEEGGQEFAIWHAVQQQANGRKDDTHLYPIELHVFYVRFGQVAPRPQVFDSIGKPQLFRLLKPPAHLGSGSRPLSLAAVADPPVGVIFQAAHNAWGPVPEFGLDPTRPQIWWLIHMIVQGYNSITCHA